MSLRPFFADHNARVLRFSTTNSLIAPARSINSIMITCYFLAPETPGPIEVKSVDSRSAVLDWQREHRGFLDGFYLETVPPEGEMIRPKRNTDKQREIADLKPGKKYTVKVHSTAYGLLIFRPSERSIITLPEAPLGDLVVISRDPVTVPTMHGGTILLSYQTSAWGSYHGHPSTV